MDGSPVRVPPLGAADRGNLIDDLDQESITVNLRLKDGGPASCLEWRSAGADLLCRAAPWRTFRWHPGQRHYSGTFWSSTERDHVIYESRLELACLLFAYSRERDGPAVDDATGVQSKAVPAVM